MNSHTCFRRMLVVALAVVSSLGIRLAGAATVVVTNTNDSGLGSLRHALADAADSAGADTITFSIPGSGVHTITLSSELVIASDVTVDGTSQPGYVGSNLITVSGNNASRVFNVTGGTVGIQALTITGGRSEWGGGILNFATLTLANCNFSGNTAVDSGGLSNNRTLTLTNCTFSGNTARYSGGGFANINGTLTLTNCTFSGNTAGSGGGLYNEAGDLTLTCCTISGNSAQGFGGGLFNEIGDLTLTCCTVSGNAASSGGGGVFSYSGSTVSNSIVANSTGGDIIGPYTDSGFNIVEDGVGITQPTSKSGDPLLGPLADNGGPTQTCALLPGSPAINAGNCAGPTVLTDQRGISRPQGAACDIGAYEFVPLSTTTGLTSSPNPSILGQQVTLTATVAATPPATAVPTGTVTFLEGPTTLGTVALGASGAALWSSSALPAGNHSITARYDGNASFETSISAPLVQAVRISSTTLLTSSLNPSVFGQSVALTATVAGTPPGAGTPTGSVQFAIDGANFGDPVPLDGGALASINIDSLAAGNHSVVANYGGDACFTPSSGPLAGGQVVSAEPDGADTAPPSPNPSEWLSVPAASGTTSIHMEAAPAGDPSGVEYYFQCTDGGGHDSGWQDSSSYDDTDLQPGTTYTYRVATRDKSANQNTGDWSTAESTGTDVEEDSGRPIPRGLCGGIAGLQLAATACALWLMRRRRS